MQLESGKKITRYFSLFTILLLLSGCSYFWDSSEEADFKNDLIGHQQDYLFIDDDIEPDPEVVAFINEYAVELNRYMNRLVTKSTGVIERGQPESPLGNLTADILKNRATREMGHTVDVALLNRGGLRIPIPEGDVTVGTIYELMPFENHITILRFTGSQMIALANELAKEGGEPISGMRFRIENGVARDLLVGDNPIDTGRHYWLATNNWLADGGGDMPTLWNPVERIDLDVMLRDAFIEYLRHVPEISPKTDNRVR